MGYLDELKPSLTYDRWDYVRALRALLPRGIAWGIPLPNEHDIRLFSILTAERFGRVTITTGNIVITPDGIASAESFGLLFVLAHNMIEMSGIPSGEAFGQPTTNEQFLTMLSIASAEGWGSPTIKPAFVHFCDFSVGLCPGFDSEFYTNWYQTTEHNEGIAQSGASDVISRLYPVSGFTGDFILEFGIWKSFPIDPETASIHMFLFSTDTDNMLYDVKLMTSIGTQPHISANGAIYPITTSPTEYNLRIIRVAGVIWSYIWDWDSNAWLRIDAWPTPGSEMIYSGACYFKVSGTEAANGFSYISINGAVA